MVNRRLAAAVALLCFVAGLVLLPVALVRAFPADLVVVVALALAGGASWQGLVGTGSARRAWWILAALLVVGVLAWVVHDGVQWLNIAALAMLLVSVAAAKRAFSVHVTGLAAPAPTRAVVVYNVESGGGRARCPDREVLVAASPRFVR